VVAFHGKLTYESFAQRKCAYGLQKELLYGAQVYVLPSTVAQNAKAKGELMKHFRKLAQLIVRTETARDTSRA
jgi:hypothetical protein